MKNVVLFTVDTLRRDVLGCYGSDEGLTPFLDSIQDRSLRFTRGHSVAPYTQASFPGILTSSYLFDYPRAQNLNPGRTLISEPLKKAGIVTAGFHSNPYLCSYFGWGRGWDHYYDSMEDEVDDACPYIDGATVNRKADAWLASHVNGGGDRPFFMWVHYMDVHEPYVPAREYIDAVDPSIQIDTAEMMRLFKEVVLTRDVSDPDTVELLRKLYKAHVRQVDDYAKMLFEILEKRGVLDDTVVIFTSDHGDEFGDHGSLSHDGKFFSELVHVPLFAYNYEQTGGQVSDQLVSGLDLSPTIVDLFGLEPEPNFQGTSFLPLDGHPGQGCFGEAMGKLSHKVKETDRPAYFYREGDLKVTYRLEDQVWELYDLAADPAEQKNIIDASPHAASMKEKLEPRIDRPTK